METLIPPVYHHDLHHVWTAFIHLSRSRPQYYGGAGPIIYSEILSYMMLHGYNDSEENRFFLKIIHELDIVFMKRETDNQSKNIKKAESDTKLNG